MQRVIGQVTIQAIVGREGLSAARELVKVDLPSSCDTPGECIKLRAIGLDVG
jgi:hypothetical protein